VENTLVRAVRTGLAELADPAKAPEMQRYMKSELPFRGVPKPRRQTFTRRVFAEFPLPDSEAVTAAVRELWHEARFREERYVATDLTGYRTYLHWQDASWLSLYEELIVTGAWWDHVDELAARRIGPLLRADPAAVRPKVRRWAQDTDRWLRRTAVICQLGSKAHTDTELLTYAIESTVDDPDFFLRKAIGWALREHAKTDPDWVLRFVGEHPGLSPLSRREATKHLH